MTPAMTDLATLSLADLARFDFRAPGRDPAADATAVAARVEAALATVPDDAWDRPISESAAPGAPPWTFMDHVGHVAVWDEEAARSTTAVLEGADWPSDDDYGDIDAWNETCRPRWAGWSPARMRAWCAETSAALLDVARRLPPDLVSSDDAWDWTWSLLHEHAAEHIALAEDGDAA